MVTGGSGLVGQGIRHAIETTEKRDNEEWIFLTSKDGNLLDLSETEALFEKFKPTHVIHLAALVWMYYSAFLLNTKPIFENEI